MCDDLYRFLSWQGKGENEKGIEKATGKVRVVVDPKYYRPTEVVSLSCYMCYSLVYALRLAVIAHYVTLRIYQQSITHSFIICHSGCFV